MVLAMILIEECSYKTPTKESQKMIDNGRICTKTNGKFLIQLVKEVQGLRPNECLVFVTGYISKKKCALHRVKQVPCLSPALSRPSVGPFIVEPTQTQYLQNLHYTNGKRILKYGLNCTVNLEAIRILREDTI